MLVDKFHQIGLINQTLEWSLHHCFCLSWTSLWKYSISTWNNNVKLQSSNAIFVTDRYESWSSSSSFSCINWNIHTPYVEDVILLLYTLNFFWTLPSPPLLCGRFRGRQHRKSAMVLTKCFYPRPGSIPGTSTVCAFGFKPILLSAGIVYPSPPVFPLHLKRSFLKNYSVSGKYLV